MSTLLGKFRLWAKPLAVVLGVAGGAHGANAHGIAGNRSFPGTPSFDDPAVADEFAVQSSRSPRRATDGAGAVDTSINWSFMRLLTPEIAGGINSGWIHRSRNGFPSSSGSDQTSVTLKGLVYKNEPHETLVSGAQGVGRILGAGLYHHPPGEDSGRNGLTLIYSLIAPSVGPRPDDSSPVMARRRPVLMLAVASA